MVYAKNAVSALLCIKARILCVSSIDCDDIWQKIPDYAELVTHFKPNGLRANLTVLRWLLDTRQIVIDEALKDDLAELERIQALFNKLKESVPCIASYYQMLQQRFDSGKTSLKSVRLALQPAIDLISSQAVTDYPTQEQLNHYLSEKIGQMAAITGFINHLKSAYHRELGIDRKLIQQMKAKRLKKHYSQRLVELYKQAELTAAEQMELVSVVLYSLHSIKIKKPKLDAIVLLDGVAYYRDKTKDLFPSTRHLSAHKTAVLTRKNVIFAISLEKFERISRQKLPDC